MRISTARTCSQSMSSSARRRVPSPSIIGTSSSKLAASAPTPNSEGSTSCTQTSAVPSWRARLGEASALLSQDMHLRPVAADSLWSMHKARDHGRQEFRGTWSWSPAGAEWGFQRKNTAFTSTSSSSSGCGSSASVSLSEASPSSLLVSDPASPCMRAQRLLASASASSSSSISDSDSASGSNSDSSSASDAGCRCCSFSVRRGSLPASVTPCSSLVVSSAADVLLAFLFAFLFCFLEAAGLRGSSGCCAPSSAVASSCRSKTSCSAWHECEA